MSTSGDLERTSSIKSAMPDASPTVWVVNIITVGETGEDNAPRADALCAGLDMLPEFGAELVVLGDVIECSPERPGRHRIAIVAFPDRQALSDMQAQQNARDGQTERSELLQTCVGVECRLMDVPNDMAPSAAENLDHVINIITYQYVDPQVIEDFLAATRGMAREAGAEREAWFEVDDVLWGSGATFDEVFVARWANVEAWYELRRNKIWWQGVCDLRAGLSGFTEMLIRPTVNRIAETRPR